jgi:hypothetical protein
MVKSCGIFGCLKKDVPEETLGFFKLPCLVVYMNGELLFLINNIIFITTRGFS